MIAWWFRSVLMLSLVSLLAGCVGGDPPTIPVATRWNKAIQQYNLVPIYPMQEDVQIGDVFLYVPPYGGDARNSQPSTWLNRLGSPSFIDTLNVLNAEYCHRVRMEPEPIPSAAKPATTAADPSKPATPPTPAPTPVTLMSSTSLPGVATTTLQISVPPAAKAAAKTPDAKTPDTPAKTELSDYKKRCEQFDDPAAWAAEQAAQKQAAKPPAKPAKPAPAAAGPSAAPAADAGAATAAATYPADVHKMGAGFDLRMRSVALPEIAVASVTDAELTAAAPISGFLAKIGLSASSNVGLDISLSGIEEVHLPFKDELTLYELERVAFAQSIFPPYAFLEYINQKRPDLLASTCYVDLKALNDSHMHLMVANEVVYAHGIDYAYRSGSTFAGQLGASLIGASAPAASKPSTAASGASTSGTIVTTSVTTNTPANGSSTAPAKSTAAEQPANAATTTPSVEDATQAAVTAAGTKLNGLVSGLSGPGGALQVGIGRTGNLTLSEKFAQPMAFGIGDLLEFSPSDLLNLYRRLMYRAAPDAKKNPDGSYSDPQPDTDTGISDRDRNLLLEHFALYYSLRCRSVIPVANRLTLGEYIFSATETEVQAKAKTPPPDAYSRFRPFEGLPMN